MIELDWREEPEHQTAWADFEWLAIWIEPLDREEEGRFVWAISTPAAGTGSEYLLIDCGVEISYEAAKAASAESAYHFVAMGIAAERCQAWLP